MGIKEIISRKKRHKTILTHRCYHIANTNKMWVKINRLPQTKWNLHNGMCWNIVSFLSSLFLPVWGIMTVLFSQLRPHSHLPRRAAPLFIHIEQSIISSLAAPNSMYKQSTLKSMFMTRPMWMVSLQIMGSEEKWRGVARQMWMGPNAYCT